MNAQVDLTSKIYVDCFAGGGGWSTGFELATGKVINIAINHSPDAIRMHKTNHPYTEHYQEDVFLVDPKTATHGQEVGWAHFSPDCKHFSRAKGSPLVDRKIRGLAWVVLHWADQVRPDIISLENVVEFQTWGPLIETVAFGRRATVPDPERAGEYFKAFIGMLTTGVEADCEALDEVCECLKIQRNSPEARRLINGLGYKVEFRELVAADYGAPTIRKRFFLIARCDGRPIVWPKHTHAHPDSKEVKRGKCKPWRTAAEIIDWSLPMYSVFDTKAEIKDLYGATVVRPLADNTMRRVIRGTDKFTIRSGKPFLVECNHSGDGHIAKVDKPLGTVTAKCTKGICGPLLSPVTFSNTGGSVGTPANQPIGTVRTAGGQVLSAAFLAQYHTEQTEAVRGQGLQGPLQTVDASNRYSLISANLVDYFSTGKPIDITEPMHTVTTRPREALTAAHICKYFGDVVGTGAENPLPTVTAVDHNALSVAHIVKFKGQDLGQPPTYPLHTITTSAGEFAICKAVIVKAEPVADIGHWPEIRALLNQHCGYHLTQDEIILLIIAGVAYYIRDILLRMLTPRELYNAMGFPPDYIIDHDYTGAVYGKSLQVARCGNAVPPPFATALVRANLPERCVKKSLTTMAELERRVAV